MSPDPRRALGQLGERLAEEHLSRAGYRVLERNFRTRCGELDLVAVGSGCLVFCEVKTRLAGSANGPAGPLDAIGPGKRRRLRMMAGQWLAVRSAAERPHRAELRFDAIGIRLTAGGRLVSLEHVENAF